MNNNGKFSRLKMRLAREVPEDENLRLREFATDIAFGNKLGAWSESIFILIDQGEDKILRWGADRAIRDRELWQMLNSKWTTVNLPNYEGICKYGYFIPQPDNKFDLSTIALELPSLYADVFISYKRSESSAFALLVESRIRQETDSIPFLDKELDAGYKWHSKLREKIADCEIFICLLAPNTLLSSQVRKEIGWAFEDYKNKKCQIIPVWHKGYDKNKTGKLDLISDDIQAIVVKEESAAGYDFAVSEIFIDSDTPLTHTLNKHN